MRTLKLVALGVLFIVGRASWRPTRRRLLPKAADSFSTSALADSGENRRSPTARRFPIYRETGAVAAAHSIGGGTLFDVGVGARVWKNAAVGLAYSTITNKNDATISRPGAASPDLRPAANGDCDRAESRALRERRSSAVHVDDPADQQDRRHGDGRSVVLHRAPDARHSERSAGHQRACRPTRPSRSPTSA